MTWTIVNREHVLPVVSGDLGNDNCVKCREQVSPVVIGDLDNLWIIIMF